MGGAEGVSLVLLMDRWSGSARLFSVGLDPSLRWGRVTFVTLGVVGFWQSDALSDGYT